MEGGGGVHSKFMHILVQEFVSSRKYLVPCIFCLISFLRRIKCSQFTEPMWSVHTSASLIFDFSNKNGKRKYYLSLSYLHILKYRMKWKIKKMVRKIDHFSIFLILTLNSKIQKILLTAKNYFASL